jgi:hypothetical protein
MSIGENLFYPLLAGCPVGGGGVVYPASSASWFSVWAFFFFRPWFWFWFGLVFCVGLIGWVGLGWVRLDPSELRIVGWWS